MVSILNTLNNFEKYKENKKKIIVSGRILEKRNLGNLIFYKLFEEEHSIQLISNDKKIKEVNIGDIVKIEGICILSNSNERSINILNLEIISSPFEKNIIQPQKNEINNPNSLLSLKLLSSPEDLKNIKIKSLFLSLLNNSLSRKYCYIDIPILQEEYGGALAKPFITELNCIKKKYFLNISLELKLKELIISGMTKVYSIGKVFRNEGVDKIHNPEFMLLELYDTKKKLNKLIFYIVRLIRKTYNKVNKKLKLNKSSFYDYLERMDCKYFCEKYGDINIHSKRERKKFIEEYNLKDIDEELNVFEKNIKEKCLIIDYLVKNKYKNDRNLLWLFNFPKITNLAKEKNSKYIYKSEIYFKGVEILNGYEEENQYVNLIKNNNIDINKEFLENMKLGMNSCSGIGIGLDRLISLIFDIPFKKY